MSAGIWLAILQAAVVEKVLHEADRLDVGQRELVDMHRLLVKVAGMEELDAERQLLRRPERLVVPELDFPVFVVIQLVGPQHLRQVGPGRMKRLARALLGPLGDVIQRHLGGLQLRECLPRHHDNQPKPSPAVGLADNCNPRTLSRFGNRRSGQAPRTRECAGGGRGGGHACPRHSGMEAQPLACQDMPPRLR